MTPEQCRLVQTAWTELAPQAERIAALFYQRLFEIEPTTRALFQDADPVQQQAKLMHVIGAAVDGLQDPDALVPTLEALGRRHAGYGVQPHHYDVVGEALLWTLERRSGESWHADLALAWTRAYELLAGVMLAAAGETDIDP